MTVTVYDIVPGDVVAPAPARPRVLLVGTALVTAAVLAVFAGLIGVYANQRAATIAGGDEWIPGGAGTIPLTPASVMFVTLVMSSIVVQWAHYAIVRDDRRNAYIAFGLAAVLAAAFINQAAFLFGEMGWVIADSVQAVLIYAIAGGQLAMFAVAVVFLALMALRAFGGQITSRDHEAISAAALFWHASVLVYAVVWTAVYQIK